MPNEFPDLRELKRGEETAWTEAFRVLWPVALQAAMHHHAALTPEEAEEAASDALKQIVSRIENIETAEELEALLATIAYRNAISLARGKSAAKRGLKFTVSLDDNQNYLEEHNQIQTPITCELTELETLELTELLRQTLDGLDEESRVLLKENVLEELSLKKLSEKYEMPVGTVASKLRRGLRKIRDNLEQSPKLKQVLKDFLR